MSEDTYLQKMYKNQNFLWSILARSSARETWSRPFPVAVGSTTQSCWNKKRSCYHGLYNHTANISIQ